MTLAGTFLRAARDHFDQGQFDLTVELCREGLRLTPDDAGLWQLCGAALYELGLVDDAREALETASCLAPLGPLAQCTLADIYVRSRQFESARAICTHLAGRDDCPVPLLPRVARGLGRLGEFGLALAVCERLAALRPTHHAAHFAVAFYRSLLGHAADQLLPHLLRAHELAPRVLSYCVSLASVLTAVGRLGQAYDVIRDVSPEAVHCAGCVRRMLDVFAHAGDRLRAACWSERLVQMAAC
jgi:tetratricopeptide (TPR) repeat protein